MKKNLLVVAAILCVGAVACSKDEPKDYTLEGVLYEVADGGKKVWVETRQVLNEDWEVDGKPYRDMNALLQAVRAAGYVADTALPEGKIDTENKKFGCALLRKEVYNFITSHIVTTSYYTEECACLNRTRSGYGHYGEYWTNYPADDTIFVWSNHNAEQVFRHVPLFHVSDFSKTFFEGNYVGDRSRTYRFELIDKSILISAGLTKIDDFED
jgi:hypothetical protein